MNESEFARTARLAASTLFGLALVSLVLGFVTISLVWDQFGPGAGVRDRLGILLTVSDHFYLMAALFLSAGIVCRVLQHWPFEYDDWDDDDWDDDEGAASREPAVAAAGGDSAWERPERRQH